MPATAPPRITPRSVVSLEGDDGERVAAPRRLEVLVGAREEGRGDVLRLEEGAGGGEVAGCERTVGGHR